MSLVRSLFFRREAGILVMIVSSAWRSASTSRSS
jgi:hypothetical protein